MNNEVINHEMTEPDFRRFAASTVDFAAKYLYNLESLPVLPGIKPGELKSALPDELPEEGEDFRKILEDTGKYITPAMTHWNHPGFMAYFNSTSGGAGILAELLSAVYNNNAMLWKSGPASTELEEVTLEWFRKLVNINDSFRGFIYDTASVSVMHAFSAARENLNLGIRENGITGRSLPKLKVYASEHAHSSIDKSALLMGTGLDGIVKIKSDDNFAMIPEQLEEAIKKDINEGSLPLCIVATIGTTSITSVDPVEKIAAIAKKYNVWLHIDAAHAGVTGMLPEMSKYFTGHEAADSIVINPHKWMFVPVDLSVLFIKNPDILKRAFSLSAEYLKTDEDDIVTNYMDYGIQLGRRFRSLKFWYVMRYFGKKGLQSIIRSHITTAGYFLEKIKSVPEFEIMAPVPFSTVCFRFVPDKNLTTEKLNGINSSLLEIINRTGKVFLSHTKLNGKFTIRVVFSGLRHTVDDADKALQVILSSAERIRKENNFYE